jgi:aldose 1-epimerase
MSDHKLRFRVIEEKFGAYSSFKLTDYHTGEYAIVLPYLGGTINSIVLKHKDQLIEILDGYTSDKDAAETINSSFKGSNLFPFPNRIKGGKYEFGGKSYQLNVNFPNENNAIHGLLFDQEFRVIENRDGDQGCKLVVIYKPVTKPEGYPFEYSLEVTYQWKAKVGFECTSRITNHSKEDIPVGVGWHPYFKIASEKVDELSLQFPAISVLEVDSKLIPTGNSKPYSVFNKLTQIADTQLDHCFVLNTESSPAEIIIQNQKTGFGYKIRQETGKRMYNYLQVYTPPTRKSIAIEPMTCIPDAFNNKTGLITLIPGKSTYTTWGVTKLN